MYLFKAGSMYTQCQVHVLTSAHVCFLFIPAKREQCHQLVCIFFFISKILFEPTGLKNFYQQSLLVFYQGSHKDHLGGPIIYITFKKDLIVPLLSRFSLLNQKTVNEA